MEPPDDFCTVSHQTESTFSEFIHYLTKNCPIIQPVKTFLFIMFSIQIIAISFCPSAESYWSSDPRLYKIVKLFGYVSIILSPTVSEPVYMPLLAVSYVIFFVSEIFLNGVHFYYVKKRYVNKIMCHFVLYFCLIVDTIFFPFLCSISCRYLTASFELGIYEGFLPKNGISLLSFIVLCYSFGRAFTIILYVNYTVSFDSALCQTCRPGAPFRLTATNGVLVLLSICFAPVKFEIPFIFIIIFIFTLINGIIELLSIHWTINWQFYTMTSVYFTSCFSSLIIIIDIFVPRINLQPYMFWYSPLVFLLSYILLSFYLQLVTHKTMKKLSDPFYPSKSRSSFYVLRDFNIGLQNGHPDVMGCTHVQEILEIFPDSFELYVYLARFSLLCNTCPIPIEEIGRKLAPNNPFSPIRSHTYISMTRLMPPMSFEEIETYNKQIVSIRRNLYYMLGFGRQLYESILDELTGTLPTATLSFEKIYESSIYRLFRFVQRYPGSPEGEFFINLFENLFPNSKDLKELKHWHNYHPDYVNIATSHSPSHIKLRLNNPEVFRSYQPEYLQKCNTNVEPLLVENEEHERILANTCGPYENVIRKWYIYLFLIVGLLLPVCFIPVFIAENQLFAKRTEHVIRAWSLIWKFREMSSFLYADTFYSASEDEWRSFSEFYNVSYDAWRLSNIEFIGELQNELLRVSTGLNTDNYLGDRVLKSILEFLEQDISFPLIEKENTTISHGLISTTFICDEMLSNDSVFLESYSNNDRSISTNIQILQNISQFYDDVFKNFITLLKEIDITKYPLSKASPLVAMIIEVFLLDVMLITIAVVTRNAIFRSNLFFMTLRETSKTAISHVRAYFMKQQDNIGTTSSQRSKVYRKHLFSFAFELVFPLILFGCAMSSCIIINFFLYRCFNNQLIRKIKLYQTFSFVLANLSICANIHQEIIFQRELGLSDVIERVDKIDSLYHYIGAVTETWWNEGTMFCPLCSRRNLYLTPSPDGKTYEFGLYNWLSMLSLSIHTEIASSFLSPFMKNVSTQFYFNCLPEFATYYQAELHSYCNSHLNNTMIYQFLTYFLLIFLIVIFLIYLISIIQRADAPFTQMVKLLKVLPEKALSRDTLRILAEHFWDFTVDHFEFDPSYYDKVLNILPDGVIVIDQTRTIIAVNQAAGNVINTRTSVIGENLFDALLIDLKEEKLPEVGDTSIETSFHDIVNDYLFDDRLTLPTHKLYGKKDNQYFFYSLTILPIFDETPDQVVTQIHGADHFALIFRDIGDEIRQQNLLEEETEKHMSIVKQILPEEIANRLLREQRSISMTVDKVAISFCDIVQFTPWCAQQTPELVVNALNYMFKIFDEFCQKYTLVTKIKCIGDCYMSAAGVFSQGRDPALAATQMVHFCLDSISGIHIVNKALKTTLRVRIGIAYGGPISAGVMGIHKPVFDIWGETVNEAQAMESSGEPMHVHIQEELYEIVKNESLIFKPKDDGTYLVC
ncbi:adenylate and guanylate cyclase [Tritrichomonas foetus]|uniref:Adenylate and guanylate cyclase n=1 Tax=Tritrichomonas foetus TaxID=1144522 RepID=A0A1J4JAQ5_9EUKA|nr:adenylate and guanylate cyclase [Tritrichomonas foetus]|eukprot:OHS95753.1 adenylate and guanylate cyclase [Tritrichomonas foetus]